MKRYVSFLFLVFSFLFVSAQVPNGFNYQAVVRNASGEIIPNTNVTLRLSILQDSETGATVYSEVHYVTTNKVGLVNLIVGNGTVVSGTFSSEGWGQKKYFIKVEIDPKGGDSFVHLGTSRLFSVPYAFYAQSVKNDEVEDADADPANEIQTLSLNGTTLTLSKNGGSVPLPSSGTTTGDNWGSQVAQTDGTINGDGSPASPLGVNHGELKPDWNKIQGMPAGFADNTDNVDDADNDPANELQSINLSGTQLTLSDGGGTVTLPSSGGGDNWGTQTVETDATLSGEGTSSNLLSVNGDLTDNQTLSVTGNDLSISGGNTVTLSDDVNDADADPTNEIQIISINGSQISLSEGGGTIDLPASGDGDITAVNTGTGLTGGGASGDVTLSVNVPFEITSGWNGNIKATNVNQGNYGMLGNTSSGVLGVGMSGHSGVTGRNEPNSTRGELGTNLYGVYGMYFTSISSGNSGYLGSIDYGAYGKHGISGRYGCLGANENGVYGYSHTGGNGVYGWNYTDGVGVRGYSGWGHAGYFTGKVHITGALSKGSGSFKIDHPLEPASKYLQHSFVESPDMMNIYNGNVILDKNGEATIQMPDWFEALNMDFRYQLTCIGGFANVYISEEINNNQFKIAGGTAGLKVSWQVTGVRKDAYANQNRIKVEIEKQGNESGKYMHPEAFGLPREMGIGYEEPPVAERD